MGLLNNFLVTVLMSSVISVIFCTCFGLYIINHYIEKITEMDERYIQDVNRITDEAFARIGVKPYEYETIMCCQCAGRICDSLCLRGRWPICWTSCGSIAASLCADVMELLADGLEGVMKQHETKNALAERELQQRAINKNHICIIPQKSPFFKDYRLSGSSFFKSRRRAVSGLYVSIIVSTVRESR